MRRYGISDASNDPLSNTEESANAPSQGVPSYLSPNAPNDSSGDYTANWNQPTSVSASAGTPYYLAAQNPDGSAPIADGVLAVAKSPIPWTIIGGVAALAIGYYLLRK